ncbi:protein-serine/threonine phosphatase [Malassezia sp. CBS 17886]|nr:protein-serine/threonine phosphatase [Malassezia sp. CBS 17886]
MADAFGQETFATLHSSASVKVSKDEALRIDRETTDRLLSQQKLALIVDLDQTIIHVTVDPTVGEWARDKTNPNWSELQDIVAFQLGMDGHSVSKPPERLDLDNPHGFAREGDEHGCWYYVKPRPGLQPFLAALAQKFELHVYTMGTRSYADCICRIVDPDGRLFGARILSRDENESLVQKSLSRLFPMNTSMVVIIDDLEFFVGIGDINATYLSPNTPRVAVPGAESKAAPAAADVDGAASTSIVSQMDAHQRKAISEQLDERPLQRQQEALEERHSKAGDTEARRNAAGQDEGDSGPEAGNSHAPGPEEKQGTPNGAAASAEHSGKDGADTPHTVLRGDDQELELTQRLLNRVHASWYAAWERKTASASPDSAPDVKDVLRAMKTQVLASCHLVFSGLIPIGQAPESSSVWTVAEEFGATCHREVNDKVTHMVSANPGTAKVEQAYRQGNISVVWPTWLNDSICRWTRQSERVYRIPRNPRMAELSAPALDTLAHDRTGSDADESHGRTVDAAAPDAGASDSHALDGLATMDWGEAEDEVDAFLGSDEDETESELDSARQSETAFGDGDDDLLRSPLSKRRRVAALREGKSKLRQAVRVDDREPRERPSAEDAAHTKTGPVPHTGPRTVEQLRREGTQTPSDSDEEHLDDFAHEMERELGAD